VTGPRYIAHFRATDGCRERIDCDAVNLEEGYLLFNRINREAGAPARAETVACFAPGAWAGYVLEPAPHTEAVEYASDDREPCNAEPEKAERRPKFGDPVHVWQDFLDRCIAGRVREVHPEGIEVDLDGRSMRYISVEHDETRTAHGSWHWPHDDDACETQPRPNAPTPIAVTINLRGAVLTDDAAMNALTDRVSKRIASLLRTAQ
jgi:hypothetical protein